MDVPILGEEKKSVNDGPQIRLLFCQTCKMLEELPDFEGRPEDDDLLQILVDKHTTTDIPHQGRLMKVPVAVWASAREEISKQVFAQMAPGLDAISPGFYNTKNQFAEDAMACYRQHRRPTEEHPCADYGTSAKVLRPDTKAERKDLGMPTVREGGPKTYLCQFCPYHSIVMGKKREAAIQKGQL